jgi:hypothetical protein
MEKTVIEAAFGDGVCIWLPMADIYSRIVISGTIATGTTNPVYCFCPRLTRSLKFDGSDLGVFLVPVLCA